MLSLCDIRKKTIGLWENVADYIVTYEVSIYERAELVIELGIRTKDALHIASAIKADADYFITTDRKLLNKNIEGIIIVNPIDFLRRYYYEG